MCRLKEASMRIVALTILAAAMVSAAGSARAQTYDPGFPFCAHVIPWGGGSFEECQYYTMAQCQAAAYGRAATCSPNPFYVGANAASKRNDRRYRRIN
jgi:hypothetical protein